MYSTRTRWSCLAGVGLIRPGLREYGIKVLMLCASGALAGVWLTNFKMFPQPLVPVDPMNVPAKFEVRSFTRSRNNRGTQKIWTAPGYAHAPFSPQFFTDFYS